LAGVQALRVKGLIVTPAGLREPAAPPANRSLLRRMRPGFSMGAMASGQAVFESAIVNKNVGRDDQIQPLQVPSRCDVR
jgi:hypothetical protein